MNAHQNQPVLSICPDCGVGSIQATKFKANNDPSRRQLGQLGAYAPGGIRPTIVVECTQGCGFIAEGPGSWDMVGKLLTNPPA